MSRLFQKLRRRDSKLPAASEPGGGRRDYIADEIRKRRQRRNNDAEACDVTGSPIVTGPAITPAAVGRPSTLGMAIPSLVVVGDRGESIPQELTRGIEPSVLRTLTPQIAHEFGVLPFRMDATTISIAVAHQPSLKLQSEMQWVISLSADRPRRPIFVRIPGPVLAQCLEVYYPLHRNQQLLPRATELTGLFSAGHAASGAVLRQPDPGPATVRGLVNGILMKAVYRGASDILFECFDAEFRIRYKVEGECEYAMTPLPPTAAGQIVSVVKQYAKLDIAESEKSQDGRFEMKIEYKGELKSIQFRVAIRPTINGEGCVIRLHDNSERRPKLEAIGADQRTLAALRRVRDHRGGLVLFSGPTGSGKTTTLAAILGECDSDRENIITIEDPVEIRLPGVTQSAVNELKGETFARMLKTALRVAPDRILVGEVRDEETAQLVIKAALTGHQVLSTVHARDAATVTTRLIEEGVSAFNLASALTLVVAQRLLNRLCEHCSRPVDYPVEVLLAEQFLPEEIATIRAREPRGCSMCHGKGTYGRFAIYETMIVSDELRTMLAKGGASVEDALRRLAVREGMTPLRRRGLDLVKKGTVSLQQVAELTPLMPADVLSIVQFEAGAPATGIRDVPALGVASGNGAGRQIAATSEPPASPGHLRPVESTWAEDPAAFRDGWLEIQ